MPEGRHAHARVDVNPLQQSCMHACTHARTQKPHQQPSRGRVSQAIIGTHCLAIARDLVAPRGSDGSGRTHLFVHCVTSQRCHTCDGSSDPSLPSTACKHSHPQAQPDTYHCACEECVAFGWGAHAACGNARGRRGARARRCAWISGCVSDIRVWPQLAIFIHLCALDCNHPRWRVTRMQHCELLLVGPR